MRVKSLLTACIIDGIDKRRHRRTILPAFPAFPGAFHFLTRHFAAAKFRAQNDIKYDQK